MGPWGALNGTKLCAPPPTISLAAVPAGGSCMRAQFLYWMKSLCAPLPLQVSAAPVSSISEAPWVGTNHTPISPSSLAQALHSWSPCTVAEILFWEKVPLLQPVAPNKCLLSMHSNSLTSPDSVWVMACWGPSLLPAPSATQLPNFCPRQWPLPQ